ncbi:uncharacterized protein LOC110985490 isoform X2 [Acanthaster planci]|uniref:Zinc finger CCHC domain-containing protein 7 n=1 Tax=Acanthaster planci TaxID=133434 RepID=A0A8B7ZBK0_ACAPL|nr:uncharacterized protein LOC110985490 isoform X2 [Acanthaster planci]
MDPLQRIITAGKGSDWDNDLQNSEEESEQDSSEDEIGEIEEALLQRIHYAEDYPEDHGSTPGEGAEGLLPQCSGETLSNITIKRLGREDITIERIDTRIGIQEKGRSLTSAKAEKVFEPISGSVACDFAKSTQVESIKDHRETFDSDSPQTLTVHGSDSESESKYKAIKSKTKSGKEAESSSASVIEISSSSGEAEGSTGRIKYLKMRNDIDVVSINCREGDSDVGSYSDSEIVFTDQMLPTPEPSPPDKATKRQWRNSGDSTGITNPVKTSTRVKLKRTVIDAELRSILNELKNESSEDDYSEAMVIESHSEDEALNVNFDSDPMQGKVHKQDSQSSLNENKRTIHRYYQESEGLPYTFFNCSKYGHMNRHCPNLKPGHNAKRCPNKKLRYLTCRRCSMKGHTEQLCPDRWRQYHLTTKPGNIQCDKSRPETSKLVAVNGKVFCYNCGKEGHFGHECLEIRMEQHMPLVLPYVVRYGQIPQRFRQVQLDRSKPPQDARGFHAPGPGAEVDSRLPPAAPKKERRKTKRKRLRAEKLAAAAAKSLTAAGSTGKTNEIQAPSAEQGTKGKKRKLEPVELATTDSKDCTKEQLVKKCRKKTKAKTEADEKLENQLSHLPKMERKTILGEMDLQHKQEASHREEILDDYEETDGYRQEIAHELAKLPAETQAVPVGKKKKKRQPKSVRKMWAEYHRGLQQQQQQQQKLLLQRQQQLPPPKQQHVFFSFNFGQFAELERKYLEQSLDTGLQDASSDASQIPTVQQSQLNRINAKPDAMPAKKRRKRKPKHNKGEPNHIQTSFKGNDPQRSVSMTSNPNFKPLSKRQQKKANYYKRLNEARIKGQYIKGDEQGVVRPSFRSDRGFQVQLKF